jgi:crotonobetainyl-CoA:carnitine CoA-transferase CaiB-like acyl-CoA transferase
MHELTEPRNVHPLTGVRVLAFTHYAAGPIAAQYLGSLGAEVIKIEAPSGDYQRSGIREPGSDPAAPSPYFLGMNRNQRALAIDLKHPGSRAVVDGLIEGADVILENFRPGVLERRGLDYGTLAQRWPRLIYCSIAAYDPGGPARTRPGQDLIIQALSGVASQTGPADGPPVAAGGYVVDTYTASQAIIGVLAALRHRELTGFGQWVRIDMMSCALHLLASETSYALNAKSVPPRGRGGIAHMHQPAPYGIYATKDGAIAIVSKPELLPAIGKALGMLDDISPHLAGDGAWFNRDAIAGILATRLRELPNAEALAMLAGTGAWVAPVRSTLEALEDPELRGMVREVESDYGGRHRVAVEPIKMTKAPLVFERPAPALGEHTFEILAELGLTKAEIEDLIAQGVAFPSDGEISQQGERSDARTAEKTTKRSAKRTALSSA